MSLLVVGLSHRTAPVGVLERAALTGEVPTRLLHDAAASATVAEAALVNTCNRIELYADVDKFHAGVAELSLLLAHHSGVDLEELTSHLYVHYEDRAVHHLFSVACGLDSMVVGEGQILGQLRDALAKAQEEHTAARGLNELFQQALRVGKRAHSETGIDKAGQSLVTFGLEQVAAGAGAIAGKRALVVGAGSMSSLAAATLVRTGVTDLLIANRTPERAERLVEILGGDVARTLDLAKVPEALADVDLVISCTGAAGTVIGADDVAAAVASRAAATPSPSSTSPCRATSTTPCTRCPARSWSTWRASRTPTPPPPAPGTSTPSPASSPRRSPPSAPPSGPRGSPPPWWRCARWPPEWSPPSWPAWTPGCPVSTSARARRSARPSAGSSTSCCTRPPCG